MRARRRRRRSLLLLFNYIYFIEQRCDCGHVSDGRIINETRTTKDVEESARNLSCYPVKFPGVPEKAGIVGI